MAGSNFSVIIYCISILLDVAFHLSSIMLAALSISVMLVKQFLTVTIYYCCNIILEIFNPICHWLGPFRSCLL
jgi:hypothetical protein